MPNRILKESICTSDSIDSLGWFDEVLFYRLIVNCDDFGRFDGRTAVIKNRLFPLKDNLTLKSVETAINKLARAGLITPYTSGGKPFLFLPTWNEHQSIRAKRSKYPDPENVIENVKAYEIICEQTNANEIKCPRNPIQSESNPIRESNQNNAHEALDPFDDFWAAYPRKTGKEAARKAFKKLDKQVIPLLVPAIERQKRSRQWQEDNGRFIPNPSTWLNQGRWEDEVETQGVKYNHSGQYDTL